MASEAAHSTSLIHLEWYHPIGSRFAPNGTGRDRNPLHDFSAVLANRLLFIVIKQKQEVIWMDEDDLPTLGWNMEQYESGTITQDDAAWVKKNWGDDSEGDDDEDDDAGDVW